MRTRFTRVVLALAIAALHLPGLLQAQGLTGQMTGTGMSDSVCGMPAPLAEAGGGFNCPLRFQPPLDSLEHNGNTASSQLLGPDHRGTKRVRCGSTRNKGTNRMIAPFATLVFLIALWLVAKVVVETLDESGGRIVAALLGRSTLTEDRSMTIPVRVRRQRVVAQRATRAQMQWRDAA